MPFQNDSCPSCSGILSILAEDRCLSCNNCGAHFDNESEDVEEYDSPEQPDYDELAEAVAAAAFTLDEPHWSLTVVLPPELVWARNPGADNVGLVNIANPSLYGDSPPFSARIASIREWASVNGYVLGIARSSARDVNGGYQDQPFRLYLAPEGTPLPPTVTEFEEEFECPLGCGRTHGAYVTRCGDTRLRCAQCRFYRSNLRTVEGGLLVCTVCRPVCPHEGCTTDVLGRFCEEHAAYWECSNCDIEFVIDTDAEPTMLAGEDGENIPICSNCERNICSSCSTMQDRAITPNAEGMLVCRRCFLGADDAEEFDEDDGEQNIDIPVIEGRENIRRCGVEIEGGNGTENGTHLARALYAEGVSNVDSMGSYHSGDTLGFSHVERDSSVDWEVVIGPVNFAIPEDVTRLNRAVRTIRERVRDGRLGLDLRAGCHIHIEAARTSLDGAFNLSTLFAYAEDTIFRLSAARWPIHRAVQDTHYTQPIPKEIRKVQFARAHAENDQARYYALSFNNYFRQMLSKCRCGATRYDAWEECTCNLGKCTFEFRVFNTTANPRKLHAYFALTQALVAYAMSKGKIDAEEWPAEAFQPQRFKDMPEDQKEATVASWRTRLAWMFTELPLTGEEKESLAYCVRNSELASVGEDFINSLLVVSEEQTTEEVTQ